jgi:hypothetical protein
VLFRSLNATNLVNPIASPTQTINYSFTVTDSLSNTTTDTVVVTVTSESSGGNQNNNQSTGGQETTNPLSLFFSGCGAGIGEGFVGIAVGLMLLGSRRRSWPA